MLFLKLKKVRSEKGSSEVWKVFYFKLFIIIFSQILLLLLILCFSISLIEFLVKNLILCLLYWTLQYSFAWK